MKGGKKILIIDDDAAILDSLSMLLEFEGYQVSTGSDAVGLFKMVENLPDLLVLDIWLSGTDGRDICKKLKKNDLTKDLPVVLISASREIEKSTQECGANDFLSKPFDVNDLLAKIEKLIAVKA